MCIVIALDLSTCCVLVSRLEAIYFLTSTVQAKKKPIFTDARERGFFGILREFLKAIQFPSRAPLLYKHTTHTFYSNLKLHDVQCIFDGVL
jgi:hypothetical protein